MDGRISELYAIERRVVDIVWTRLKDKEHYRMQEVAVNAGVWNTLFPVAQLEDDLDDAKREIKRRAPCCFVCRRKL
jgi:hypothetical protein